MTELAVPDEYDPESYRAGYAAAMHAIGQRALAGAASLDAPPAEADDDADAEAVCRECGAPTTASMGAAETAASPAGRKCVACEA